MFMAKYDYLLTGASGFLGGVINEYLTSNAATVITLDRNATGIKADITQPIDIDNGLQVDVVIHNAGKAHYVPRTTAEEKVFFDVNLQGTKNLCHAIEQLIVKPRALIFISTVAVYGVDAGKNISETHPLNGNTPYAKSKIEAEEWLTAWAKQNDILLGILRLPLVAGPNPPGNLGAMIKGIKSGRYLSIGSANARKSVVWAADIAAIMPVLAQTGGVFNVTDGHNPNFAELEAVIAQALQKKKPTRIPMFIAKLLGYVGDVLGHFPLNSDKLKKITSTLTFDDSKARKLLDWTPSPVLIKLSETI
ncbi:NAD-dependent epimerase/dehydratase family protein [Inquilinus sp. KBS0705]|nr:NAD-dependent epimerase/dehydratase family protein [Inquilinus sp. KBS0705]